MRHLLFGVLLFVSSNAFGQSSTAEVLNYIENQKSFTALTDTAKLPYIVRLYYNSIVDYISEEDLKGYYVKIDDVRTEGYSVLVPLYHYDGFKKQKELEDEGKELNKNRREGETRIVKYIVGNASGKDGTLEIDMGTKKVVVFWMWQ